MGFNFVSKDTSWWVFTIPAFLGVQGKIEGFLMLSLAVVFLFVGGFSAGGVAWRNGRNRRGQLEIPGPYGLPVFGNLLSLSRGLAHRTLASMAISQDATQLMAFSLGSTPVVVSSDPHTAREILTSPHFANRPIKQSAMMLMFSRAIGFAPNGTYWLRLRRIASSNLFAPKCIMAHEVGRQLDCTVMLNHIAKEQDLKGAVYLRKHLQDAALNNIMGIVFGKRYNMSYSQEAMELREMVREGFELLGAFNWSDHLPWLSYFYDPSKIKERCTALTPRVTKLVQTIIKEHKNNGSMIPSDNADFVDILLALDGEEKLEDNYMIAVLWEMIFRGTDTVALLTEWVMAELILNPDIQTKLQQELDCIVGNRNVTTADTASLPYLQAVVTETLRVHPPGPLLSWCRYSSSDVLLSNGMLIPANTTAMVNMWAISHDSNVWDEPLVFKPERFIKSGVDVRGNGLGLRLAPFGAGARMCPGKSLGLATVNLWVAKLVQNFKWVPNKDKPVELTEVLKLSCQMKKPLSAVVVRRDVV